jgi:hypothetical protein
MAAIGINFRATSGFKTDGAGQTYSLGTIYPETRGGFTFGWTVDMTGQALDRADSFDPELAGMIYAANSGSPRTFRIDLPGTGPATIRLAIGDTSARDYQYCVLKDDTTTFATIDDPTGTAFNEWLDATGASNGTTWEATNTSIAHTFTSTIFNVVIGTPGSQADLSSIAHVSIDITVAGGGGGGGKATHFYRMLGG